jgi:hypothetical protein
MRAMLFDGVASPLRLAEVAVPEPGPGQLLLRVLACVSTAKSRDNIDAVVAMAMAVEAAENKPAPVGSCF